MWHKISDIKPPEGEDVLIWSEMNGIKLASYFYIEAWKPFDESKYGGGNKEIVDNLRRIHEMNKGNPEKEILICAC